MWTQTLQSPLPITGANCNYPVRLCLLKTTSAPALVPSAISCWCIGSLADCTTLVLQSARPVMGKYSNNEYSVDSIDKLMVHCNNICWQHAFQLHTNKGVSTEPTSQHAWLYIAVMTRSCTAWMRIEIWTAVHIYVQQTFRRIWACLLTFSEKMFQCS